MNDAMLLELIKEEGEKAARPDFGEVLSRIAAQPRQPAAEQPPKRGGLLRRMAAVAASLVVVVCAAVVIGVLLQSSAGRGEMSAQADGSNYAPDYDSSEPVYESSEIGSREESDEPLSDSDVSDSDVSDSDEVD